MWHANLPQFFRWFFQIVSSFSAGPISKQWASHSASNKGGSHLA